ncbi:MAG: hypothetical protein K6T86_17845 [Pirellulales bacterium]|nr:hypothetical protein [Pirellulales bacterium]
MAWTIGIDEAGYGPNLGPLVVAASVWRMPDARLGADFYPQLVPAIVQHAQPAARRRSSCGDGRSAACQPLWIADSKRVYSRTNGLGKLERGVLGALAACGRHPRTVGELWQIADVDAGSEPPWHVLDAGASLPRTPLGEELPKLAGRLIEAFRRSELELCEIRVRVAFPREFNGLLRRVRNKAEVEQVLLLDLLSKLEPWMHSGPGLLLCDRLGGRARYAALVQQVAGDYPVCVLEEGVRTSAYQWQAEGERVEMRFEIGGERHLPVALASMAAKYLRELAMADFNRWWLARQPGLFPTSGYPGDAGKFMNRIAPLMARLGIERSDIWRDR